MAYQQKNLIFRTQARHILSITHEVNGVVTESGIDKGLCHCFIMHTSASLLITENSDSAVGHDLESCLTRLVKDGADYFTHVLEGEDDMSAHIRTVLTQTSVMIPINQGQLVLGTWQGLFLWEHRYQPHSRHVMVSIIILVDRGGYGLAMVC